jgi:hypothetical protein
MRPSVLAAAALLVCSVKLSGAEDSQASSDPLPVNTTKPEFAEPVILGESDVFERVSVVDYRDPKFSPAIRKSCPEGGKAHIRGVVGRNGKITKLVVVSETCKGLGGEFIKTVVKWHFKPATVNGRPFAVYYEPRLNYEP